MICDFLLSDKHLRPVVAACNIAHADLFIGAVENIGAVTGGIHPARHDGLRRTVAHGDILTRAAVSKPEGPHHLERRAVGRTGVVEVTAVMHVL